ncbi:MAG: DUF2263 domain-containing protein [Spirochaetales bacterium]|nr:DUF2263 domain-containing protein [Spirochaetales bacterium]
MSILFITSLNRNIRAKTANETLSILKKGWYEKNGKKINIKKELENTEKNTILYSPPMMSIFLADCVCYN